jgi:Ras family protein T1
VNSIEIRGTEKYLVVNAIIMTFLRQSTYQSMQVQEVAPGEAKTILDDKSKLNKADVLCFVYDISDANSFSYIVNLRVRLNGKLLYTYIHVYYY